MALEKAGKLHPVRDRRTNVRHFERGEVLQLARVRGVRVRIAKLEIFDDCEVAIRVETGEW